MARINWQADLTQLAAELPGLHKNLFFNQGEKNFNNSILALQKKIPDLDNYQIVMEIAKIVAAIGDAHTMVVLPRQKRLPVECYCFQEGVFITAALVDGTDLLHQQLVAIDGLPIATVIERFTGIISHENQSFLLSQLPGYLVCADILFGLAIAEHIDHIMLTIADRNQGQRDVPVSTLKYEEWERCEKVQATDQAPLYRKNQQQYYWREFDSARKLLYVNYNHCKNMATCTVDTFSRQLKQAIKRKANIERLVIDLRNNGGGNSELFQGFLQWLRTFDRLNQPGRLFVIVGRDTFSSALLNTYYLKINTKAIFLGEPTGGKPNCYGEVQYLSLHHSGLYIRYSTKYYDLVDDDDLLSFMPDIPFAVTFADYLANIDPCLEWIYEEFC